MCQHFVTRFGAFVLACDEPTQVSNARAIVGLTRATFPTYNGRQGFHEFLFGSTVSSQRSHVAPIPLDLAALRPRRSRKFALRTSRQKRFRAAASLICS